MALAGWQRPAHLGAGSVVARPSWPCSFVARASGPRIAGKMSTTRKGETPSPHKKAIAKLRLTMPPDQDHEHPKDLGRTQQVSRCHPSQIVNPKVRLCKPSSVPIWRRAAIIYLDQPLPTGSPANGKRSTRRPNGRGRSHPGQVRPGPQTRNFAFGNPFADRLLDLAGGGVSPAGDVAAAAVRSYRTISPLPEPLARPSAVCFLWHFPWVRRIPRAITRP